MNAQKIKILLKKEEGFKLDFKLKLSIEQDSDKKELVKDVIAIANTPGGRGYILYGVEDRTKKIVGLTHIPSDVEERIQQMIGHRSRPPVSIKWETVKINNKVIGVLTIYKSNQIPHQMLGTGSFYVRRGSTTDVATRHEIATMLQSCGLVSFETVPCYSASLEELDFQMISKCLGVSTGEKQGLAVLYALGIIIHDEFQRMSFPTYGGLLIFGNNPQKFLPHTFLEIEEEGGKIKRFEGNIMTQILSFRNYITQKLSETYPVDALIEVVANGLIHRDYWNDNYCTTIKIDEEQIIVMNPSTQTYEIEQQSQFRTNNWLYARLLLLRQQSETFRVGIGLNVVRKSFEEGSFRIENDIEHKLFKVYLPIRKRR